MKDVQVLCSTLLSAHTSITYDLHMHD